MLTKLIEFDNKITNLKNYCITSFRQEEKILNKNYPEKFLSQLIYQNIIIIKRKNFFFFFFKINQLISYSEE